MLKTLYFSKYTILINIWGEKRENLGEVNIEKEGFFGVRDLDSVLLVGLSYTYVLYSLCDSFHCFADFFFFFQKALIFPSLLFDVHFPFWRGSVQIGKIITTDKPSGHSRVQARWFKRGRHLIRWRLCLFCLFLQMYYVPHFHSRIILFTSSHWRISYGFEFMTHVYTFLSFVSALIISLQYSIGLLNW